MNEKLLQLQLKLNNIERENIRLKAIILDYQDNFPKKFAELLSNIFSKTQIEILLNPKGKVSQWSCEDIASSITLRSISPKAYCYLRNKLNYPLPGILKF